MTEIWKDVIGYEGLYEVSDLGNVRSNWHCVTIVMSPQDNLKGYLTVSLTARDGSKKRKYIHRMVFSSFVGFQINDAEINHIDGNPKNNCLSNLEECSRGDNHRHAYKILGRRPNMLGRKGPKHPKSKTYRVTRDGEEQVVDNLQKFCDTHNLTYTSMISVASGRFKEHRGFKVSIVK